MSNQSFSPISGETYNMPETMHEELTKFIDSQCQSKTIVAVQGLGFVGTAMSVVLANKKDTFSVIGVDKKSADTFWKIGDLNNGNLPIVSSDPKFKQYYLAAIERNKNFFATFEEESFGYADVIVVDVNLDVHKDYSKGILEYEVPMDSFKNAIISIGRNCKEDALVLVETTVPPGTCQNVVLPTLKKELKKRGLSSDKIKVGHSYERVMPGPNYIDSIENFYRVYSGIDDKSAAATEKFLKGFISTKNYPLTKLNSTIDTEIAKVLENSYRAMNISFMIEWSRLAENSGADMYKIVDAIRQRPTHSNLMLPGIGVGGYCLTKDPLLASWASKNFYDLADGLSDSERAVVKNDKMPDDCFNFLVKSLKTAKNSSKDIALFGVAYAPGVGDTRFSPVDIFYEKLKEKDFNVYLTDPYVRIWEEKNIDIENNLSKFLKNDFDVLCITTGHKDFLENEEFIKFINKTKRNLTIIDTVGLLNSVKISDRYILGKNYFILGVGNKK